MFIAVYEFDVKVGKEQEFRQSWLKFTQGIYLYNGSLGSRLHKESGSDSNVYIGYAQWKDRSTWENTTEINDAEYAAAGQAMKECINSSKTVYELEVVEDYLQRRIFAA